MKKGIEKAKSILSEKIDQIDRVSEWIEDMAMKIQQLIPILLVVFCLSACNHDENILEFSEYDWELVHINNFNDEVYSPSAMWFDQNRDLIIIDRGDEEQPIKILQDGVVTKTIPAGRGPGEVEFILRKFFSESKNERYIFDAAQRQMLKFDEEYNYTENLVDEKIDDGVYLAGIYSDSLAFTVSVEHILQIHNFLDKSEDQNVRFTLHDQDYEFLDPLRNYFIRQSFHYDSDGQDFYVALKYGSLIMHIDEEYNFNYTFGPDSIGIATNREDEFYALPRMGHHREGLRDLRVYGDYLLAILNGNTYGRHIQIRHMTDFDFLIDIVNHGEILLIFDRHTLDFIRAIELPLPATQIAVNDEHIFLLNYIDDAPALYVYKNHVN